MEFVKTVLILLFIFNVSYAQACSCSKSSLFQRVISSDIVIVGEVLESKQVCLEAVGEHCYGPTVFYIQQTELLKGDNLSGNLVKATFISNFGNCTFAPQKGQKFLLFGMNIPGTVNTYTTSVCSGNRQMNGTDEIPEINEIKTFMALYEGKQALKE